MSAQLSAECADTAPCVLELEGTLDAHTLPEVWPRARETVGRNATSVILDCSKVKYCDGAGVAMLVDLQRIARERNTPIEIRGLAARYDELLQRFNPEAYGPPAKGLRRRNRPLERLGRLGAGLAKSWREQVEFMGEVVSELAGAVRHPRGVRWADMVAVAEEAGINALPIVGLISFLIGVILAFQGAVVMKQFGAEMFVSNLVGLSLMRELGPLMTAILLAGRSASAFAAEIGSMKVGDELSALQTMGLRPVRFLVLPRLLAGLIVMPILTVVADVVALIGSATVMLLYDIPYVTFMQGVMTFVQPADFIGGIAKSCVFGLLIAGVGCMRGMQATTGASSVGLSATHAVVSSLVAIVIADGIFAVLFYQLDW